MSQVRRREILVRALALGSLAIGDVEAQQRTFRMAYLATGGDASSKHLQNALFARLADMGYREGLNLVVDRRFGSGELERLPALAAELLALKPDIFVTGATPATVAAMRSTGTIPIVFLGVSDPMVAGLVKSLSHPGSNVTGMSAQSVELDQKRLQLLKESIPSIVRVAVLTNPLDPTDLPRLEQLRLAAKVLGLTLQTFDAKAQIDYERVFQEIDSKRFDAIYVLANAFNFTYRAQIIELTGRRRLPAMYGYTDNADSGGLMAYAESLVEHWRKGADHIDRIFKGAKPADLPVQQPTRFELVLNLKTAKALGLTFPPIMLLRADRVIE